MDYAYEKQINILTGQASCTVDYPMSCCMILKYKLHTLPAWLLRLFLCRVITSAATKTALSWGEIFNVFELLDTIVNLIGKLGGHHVNPDTSHTIGELCFVKSHKKWHDLTKGGCHRLTQVKHKQYNALVWLAFSPPVIALPCLKENNGEMHSMSGHLNHYWKSIGNKIIIEMKGCPWQLHLQLIEEEAASNIRHVEHKIRSCKTINRSKKIKSNI